MEDLVEEMMAGEVVTEAGGISIKVDGIRGILERWERGPNATSVGNLGTLPAIARKGKERDLYPRGKVRGKAGIRALGGERARARGIAKGDSRKEVERGFHIRGLGMPTPRDMVIRGSAGSVARWGTRPTSVGKVRGKEKGDGLMMFRGISRGWI